MGQNFKNLNESIVFLFIKISSGYFYSVQTLEYIHEKKKKKEYIPVFNLPLPITISCLAI